MTTNNEINSLYDMITYNAAKTLRISDHKLIVNAPANLVILHGVKTVNEAIRKTSPARTTIRKGKIISKTSITEDQYYELEKPKTSN